MENTQETEAVEVPAEPRELTVEEVQNQVLDHFAHLVKYWDTSADDSIDQMTGLVHSLLATLAGQSMVLPGFDIVTAPHEDDAEYDRANGNNWIPDGVDINNGNLLNMWHDACKRAGLR